MFPEIEEKNITLLVTSLERYHETLPKLVESFSSSQGIYTSTNRSCERIRDSLKENRINHGNLFFVDTVSKPSGLDVEDTEKCVYVDDPRNLVNLSIKVSGLVSEDISFLIFDSLSGLLLYNGERNVEKFIHSFCSEIRSWNLKGVLLSVKDSFKPDVLTTISGFCDQTIEVK
ncbi:MAG: hypothetical protein B6U72_05325 [Candidatus Altiarchaeales archaeon ex4484_2]|nr:MAG: hypothetical protein B6U72_05325 [Candidatus Altiarchaeales archaeon ex4484_2]